MRKVERCPPAPSSAATDSAGSYTSTTAPQREAEPCFDTLQAGFERVSVEFTHQVADGMHGAIVKAVKTHAPEAKGLPVIQPATSGGCC
jgi:hypothetical protein